MKPSVTREICGSDSGYRKHRRMNEERCQPCKDAHNILRKERYRPDKNKEYSDKYRALQRAESQKKKRALSEERALKKAQNKKEIEKRKKDRIEAGIRYKEDKERRKVSYAKRLADSAAKKEAERLAIKARKADLLKKKEEKRLERERKTRERQEALQFKRAEKERIAAERKARQEALSNQHGTSINDYYRCKRKSGTACGPCLVVGSKYRREQVAKDPEKFKAQARSYRKKVGKLSSRDRAKKHGAQYAYYTRKQIFDRDGYDCYLCNTPVDLTAPHVRGQPGWENYPHVDHVIPLALGGDDTLENVKIAHAKCNVDKGIRLLPDN